MKNPLTNEQILQIIKDKAKELGRVPQRREIEMWGTIYSRFGSWNNALIKAGFVPTTIRNLSKDDIIKMVQEWAKEHGKTPSISNWIQAKKNGEYLPEVRAIQRKFDKTWNEIMELAGLEINAIHKSYNNYTDKELLDVLKKEIMKMGGATGQLKFDKLRDKNTPCATFYRTHFNCAWIKILLKVGYTSKELKYLPYSKEELIKILQDLYKTLGHTPSMSELNNFGYCEGQFKARFGNWNNAITHAGLEVNTTITNVQETDKELLQMYKKFCKKIKKSATVSDLNSSKEIYNADVFISRFGGMTELKKLAGFKVKTATKKYTKEMLIEMLLQEYKKLGRKLTNTEIKENKDLPSLNTFCRYFKTTKTSKIWEEIL